MSRKKLNSLKRFEGEKIKWRSHEPSRIEAFSDAVFAFAVSLLVISLEVPHSSKELFEMMKGFFPFAICFGGLVFIWYTQYKFFRQFGLHDKTTIWLNAILLFLVLFYVYPLKFMVSSAMNSSVYTIREEDRAPMILLYNSGFTGIFLLFALMYHNAYKKRDMLMLTAIEIFETRTVYFTFVYITLVGLVTVIFAALGGEVAKASMAFYGLMGGISILSARRDKLFHKKFGNIPVTEPFRADE